MKLIASDTFELPREPWGDYPLVVDVCLSFLLKYTHHLTLLPTDDQAGQSDPHTVIYSYISPYTDEHLPLLRVQSAV